MTSCSLQAVPASLKRYGLSQIINHLLALGKQQLAEHVTNTVRKGILQASLSCYQLDAFEPTQLQSPSG
jgi:hypothetical protein